MSGRVIVVNEMLDKPLRLLKRSNTVWKDVPPEGILLVCINAVTVFPSKKKARAAIRRTKKYFAQRPPSEGRRPWCEDEYTFRALDFEL